jgi:FkbM family methyltransferase
MRKQSKMVHNMDLQLAQGLESQASFSCPRPSGKGELSQRVEALLQGEPLRVLDVGARGGLHALFLPIADQTEIIGFDPDQKECERLSHLVQSQGWRSARLISCAVSGQGGGRVLYSTRRPELSSLLLPCCASSPDWEVVHTDYLCTESFAGLRATGQLAGRWDYLKIDVQGLEYELLQHMPADLAEDLVGVEVEGRIQQHYRGQRSLAELIDLMLARGFELVAFDPVFEGGSSIDLTDPWPPSRRRLSHGDLLFLRPRGWAETKGSTAQAQRAYAARLATIALLHGFWTLALALVGDFLPEHSEALRTLLPAREYSWRWRWRTLRLALSLLIRPNRQRRFLLARQALAVPGKDGHHWRLSPPKL